MSLRLALFGQADFGKACLEQLIERGHEIAAVFTPAPAARPDALASAAEALGLPLIQRRYFQRQDGSPVPSALESYARLDADLNVLASFTAFLPAAILNAPRHRSLCFHPSLLPRFRGGAALQWQIILEERECGVTIFSPDRGVDTGPIVLARGGVEIGTEETAGSLFFKKLSPLGVETLVEAVDGIDTGSLVPRPQDESQASFHGLVDDSVARVNLGLPAPEIDRLTRGCDPQPGAFVRHRGEPLRLYDTHLEPASPAKPGTVTSIEDTGLCIALDGGSLRVGRIRADRGKEPARQLALRAGLQVGDCLESG